MGKNGFCSKFQLNKDLIKKNDKIVVRCIHCGYEKEYKTKNKEECIVKSKGHKPHHKFRIIKNENKKSYNRMQKLWQYLVNSK